METNQKFFRNLCHSCIKLLKANPESHPGSEFFDFMNMDEWHKENPGDQHVLKTMKIKRI